MTLSNQSITSDKDYLKIYYDGPLTISANAAPDADATFPSEAFSATLAGTFTVTHNLGTVPLVRGFWDPGKNGRWWSSHAFPDSSLGLFPFQEVDPFLLMISGPDVLKLIMGTNGAAQTDIPVYVRLYDLGSKSVTSDSRIDKIFKTGQSSANASAAPDSFTPTFTTINIPHPAGEAPIWTLQFSEDNSNWYGENGKIVGPPDLASGPPGGPYSRYYYTRAFSYATATTYSIILENNYGSARTIYYRYALDYRG